MSAHSPLPWRLGFADDNVAFVNAGRNTVCKCDSDGGEIVPRANAEFICRAVNHHAELVEALKALVPPMPPADANCHSGICSQDKCAHCGRIAVAIAVLAKAQAGPPSLPSEVDV